MLCVCIVRVRDQRQACDYFTISKWYMMICCTLHVHKLVLSIKGINMHGHCEMIDVTERLYGVFYVTCADIALSVMTAL